MEFLNPRIVHVVKNPLGFTLQVLKAFKADQGLLLAGAVAYYALLSIVPLLILMVIALSHVIDEEVLLATLRRALEFVVPGEGKTIVVELRAFLAHRDVIGWVLLVTMLFFSQLGFKVLENAISVIFLHRVAVRRRHFIVSLLLPFGYIFFIGVVLFVGTFVLTDLVTIGASQLEIFGHSWSLSRVSQVVLYIVGFATEIMIALSLSMIGFGVFAGATMPHQPVL